MSSAAPQQFAPQARVGHIVSRSDAGGLRSISIAVVVHNPQRVKLVLRVRFGCTAATTVVKPFKHASPDSEEYSDALVLQDIHGADPSNLVLVISAYEPSYIAEEDRSSTGVLPVVMEVLGKNGEVLSDVHCGFSFCPTARHSWDTCSLSPPLLSQSAQDLPVHVDFPPSSTPELLPSSSSSSSASDSAFTPPPVTTSPSSTHSANSVRSAMLPGIGGRAIMKFKRTTQILEDEHGVPAALKLQGDVSLMAHGWDAEELETKRRIILFKAEHRGRESRVTFSPRTQEQYFHDTTPTDQSAAIVPKEPKAASMLGYAYINCIYDEVRDDCVITSVDLLLLLEAIFHVSFGTDEKNRIRRNLEALRPRAVIKCRPETEGLFSLIMEFCDPKPRSIEKSVKVFKWSSLESALDKIVSKFSGVRPKSEMGLASPAVHLQANQKRPSRRARITRRSIRGLRYMSASPGQSPLLGATDLSPHGMRSSKELALNDGPVLVQSDPDFRSNSVLALDLPALYDPRRSVSPFGLQLASHGLPIDSCAPVKTERLVGFVSGSEPSSPLVETPVPGLYTASPVEQDWVDDIKMDISNSSSLAGALDLMV